VPDDVTNNEIGWKSEWFEHRVRFDASLYQEIWTNAQTAFFDPQGGLGSLVFNTNGPDYRVRGFEPSIGARVTTGLTVQAAAAWNSVSQTNSPFLVDNNPLSTTYGKNITSIPNPYGPLGSPTAYSPAFKISARIRYDWTLSDYDVFWQLAGQHQDHMVSETGYVLPYDMPAFSTYDASAGVAQGSWAAEIYGQNLTNVNASLQTSGGLFILPKWPIRPRVLGVQISYRFVNKKS